MINDELRAFKREDGGMLNLEVYFHRKSTKIIKESQMLICVKMISFKNLILEGNVKEIPEDLISLEIKDGIEDIVTLNNIYLIVEKNEFALDVNFGNSRKYIKYFDFWSRVHIKINSSFKTKKAIDIIKEYSETADYLFEIDDPWNKFLKLLTDDRFVERLKEINAKISCKRVLIQVKLIKDKEEKENFIENIKKDIKKKIFGLK